LKGSTAERVSRGRRLGGEQAKLQKLGAHLGVAGPRDWRLDVDSGEQPMDGRKKPRKTARERRPREARRDLWADTVSTVQRGGFNGRQRGDDGMWAWEEVEGWEGG